MEGKAPLSTYQRVRKRTADVLYSADRDDPLTHRIDLALIILISLNVLAVVLESVNSIQAMAPDFFWLFDIVSVVIFTLEYIARVWSVVDNPWRSEPIHPVRGRIRYMFTWMALIDFMAIAPFYLSMLTGIDLRILRALRLLRIFKLTRYSSAMTLLFQVFREESRTILAAMFVATLLMVVASTLAYIIEHPHQPHAFSSIPASMYWAVITMTTVGYGDMVPITAPGRILGALISILGLGMVALPAGILASGFNNALHRRRVMLEERVHDAMEDGEINDKEQADLDTLVRRLNLNDVDARAIQFAVRHQQAKVTKGICPHCGKDLSAAPSQDEQND